MKKRRVRLWPAALATALALGMLPALGQVDFAFMPDGGRGLLGRLTGDDRERLAALAAETRDLAGWRDMLTAQGGMTKTEIEVLAGYLSVNFPLAGGLPEGAEDPMAALPPDGKQLAIDNCQTCHSIFSGYLMQDRDLQGWRSVFQSPFHSELPMTAKERETFALYSAATMPLDYEDVPPELRF